jgi:hypothetical protein
VKCDRVSTSAAVKIGVLAPLLALFLLIVVTVVSVLSRASDPDDDIKSRPLRVVFPLAALVGGALLAGANALLALVFDADIAHAALAGGAAGAVSSPLLLTGLLVGFSATLSFAVPFLLDVAALLVAAQVS